MSLVIPNSSYADKPKGDLTLFSHKISDYSIMATIEWLFGLDNTKSANGKSGLGGLNNPSNIDELFAAQNLTVDSGFSFTYNGYV